MMNSNFNSMRQGGSMYGGNYGSNYGGGFGNSSYGNRAMNQNGQAEGAEGQQNQGLRSEYHGMLHGLQSTLQVAYASVQFYSFSKIFVELSKKLIQTINSLSRKGVNQIVMRLHLDKILKLFKWLLKGGIKSSELPAQNTKILNAMVIIVRIISLLALFVCLKMRSQMVEDAEKQKLIQEIQESELLQLQQQKEPKSEEFWPQQTIPTQKVSVNYLEDLIPLTWNSSQTSTQPSTQPSIQLLTQPPTELNELESPKISKHPWKRLSTQPPTDPIEQLQSETTKQPWKKSNTAANTIVF